MPECSGGRWASDAEVAAAGFVLAPVVPVLVVSRLTPPLAAIDLASSGVFVASFVACWWAGGVLLARR